MDWTSRDWMAEVLSALTEARGRVEKGWTKHEYARDADGQRVSERSPAAVSWCGVGAIRGTGCAPFAERASFLALENVMLDLGHLEIYGSISGFNDDEATTQADVLDLYDRAIRMAGSGVAR